MLFSYRHFFFPSHIRNTSIFLLVICAAWCMSACVIEIGYPGHTNGSLFPGSANTKFNITYLSFWLAMALIEVLIEISIIILPIHEVLRLQLLTKEKALASLIFALGGFVVITAVVRMSVLYRPSQPTLDFTHDIWLNVHLGTAVISACLPTYRPLISRDSGLLQIFNSRRDSYIIDDFHILPPGKKRMGGSDSRPFKESVYRTKQSHQIRSEDARRSESLSMTGMHSQENTVMESGGRCQLDR